MNIATFLPLVLLSTLLLTEVLASPAEALDLAGENTAIDFSGGEVGEDGAVCVEREEEREKVEQELETQCTQQNVTQAEFTGHANIIKNVVKPGTEPILTYLMRTHCFC